MAHYLITGASSGMGAALAVELGRRHHAVGLIARREAELAKVAERVRLAGGKAAVGVADVTDREGLTGAIRSIEQELGPVDCMVANAGGGTPTPAKKADVDALSFVMRLNYDGAIHAFAAVLPAMMERGSGHIAVVASVAGWRGLPPSGGYSAAKGAIQLLLEAWAMELKPLGIAVTTINPGFVDTPIHDDDHFPMPFLVQADKAARIIANGLEKRRRYINFPLRMAWLMTLVHGMPTWAFEWLFPKVSPTL